MLILRRKLGENISIGDQIRVSILEIQGGQVKLGIEAPAGVPIYREEVLDRIMSENKKAATTSLSVLQPDLLKQMLQTLKPFDPGKCDATPGDS